MTDDNQKELSGYVYRSVLDIARKCRVKAPIVWCAMSMLADYELRKKEHNQKSMARYKPNDPLDMIEILDFINKAKDKGFDIELKRFYKKRTNPQNAYLHFALSYFAHCYGCTLTESKEIYFKQYACRDIFRIEVEDKNGNTAYYYRSSADLNTVEMSDAINNFIAYAHCNGIEIPSPDDELGIRYCERQIEKTKVFGT